MNRRKVVSIHHRPWTRGGTILGILVGLVIGALLVAGGAWYLTRQPPSFQPPDRTNPNSRLPNPTQDPVALPGKSGGKPLTAPETAPLPPVDDNRSGAAANNASTPKPAGANPATSQPSPQVAKNDTPTSMKQPKDFYDILQKGSDAPAPKPHTEPTTNDKTLYLQVGAFENPAEADNLKAKLALNGISAITQRVDNPDKPTVLRVRIGPYAKPEDMSSVRVRLQELGIEATVVKNK